MLLQLMTEVLCRDHKHFMEDLFQASFKRISRRSVYWIALVLTEFLQKQMCFPYCVVLAIVTIYSKMFYILVLIQILLLSSHFQNISEV